MRSHGCNCACLARKAWRTACCNAGHRVASSRNGLPTSAGELIVGARQGVDDLLTPWQGLGLMALWTLALMIVANALLRRRDA